MSGPIPAGSPRVSASGRGIGRALPVFDHRAAPYFLQILLRLLLELFGEHAVADLTLAGRVFGCRLLLGADGKHFDSELGDLWCRQPADLDALEHLAKLERKVGRAADDLITHGDVLERAGKGDAFLA